MNYFFTSFVFVCLFLNTASADEASVARGRYLATIGGCNDCHTAGFAPSGGKVPEKDWLLGDTLGWRGPWGTTYPTNLRKLAQGLSKEQWVSFCRHSRARPPMPTYVLNAMQEKDLGDLFDYLKSLGDGGEQVPTALAPGIEPKTPYLDLFPKNLPSPAGR